MESVQAEDQITVSLTHSLGNLYDLPLTLKTQIPSGWQNVRVVQDDEEIDSIIINEENGSVYVMYQMAPNTEPVVIHRVDSP